MTCRHCTVRAHVAVHTLPGGDPRSVRRADAVAADRRRDGDDVHVHIDLTTDQVVVAKALEASS